MYYNQNPYLSYQQSQIQPYQSYVQQPTQQNLAPASITGANMLNGKVVDSIEVARAYDVPFGSYALMPKADLSTVWLKQWNTDGTTRIDEYKKVESNDNSNSNDTNNFEEILKQIEALSKKIDGLQKSSQSSPTTTGVRRKKAEDE